MQDLREITTSVFFMLLMVFLSLGLSGECTLTRNKEFWRLPLGPFCHNTIYQGVSVGILTIFKNIYLKHVTFNGFSVEFFLKST